MIAPDHLFYSALNHMYSHMSMAYGLFDMTGIARPPNDGGHAGALSEKLYYVITEWLSHELVSSTDEKVWGPETEALTDGYVLAAFPKLGEAVQKACSIAPSVHAGTWLDLIYHQALAQILDSFCHVMREPLIHNSPLYEKFETHEKELQQFRDKIAADFPVTQVANRHQEAVKSVNDSVKAFVETWRDGVHEMAETHWQS